MRGKSSYPICPGPALSSPTADRGSPGQRGGPEEMGPSSLPPGAISARPGSILTVCACVFCSSCHLPSQQPLRELRERVPAPLRGHPPEERLQPLLRGGLSVRRRLRPQWQELHPAPQLRLLLGRQILRGRGGQACCCPGQSRDFSPEAGTVGPSFHVTVEMEGLLRREWTGQLS